MDLLRSAFLALSHNRSLRKFMEQSRFGVKISSRFIAGMTIDDALQAAESLNRQGMAVTLDSLGESVTTEVEAHRAAEIYHKLLDRIAERKLDANISLKLTQMGLEVKPDLAEQIAGDLVKHAKSVSSFVRIDMEDSQLTQQTLKIVYRLHAQSGLRGAVGVVIQAYLYRSEADVEQLVAEGVRVRLCKGAYKEPAEVAFPHKADVDANYVTLAKKLLRSSAFHGLATHDEAMIAAAKEFAQEQGIEPSHFEFQMLYGVRRDLQRKLVAEGYKVRVYVPFGTEWYPYFMRRLAERPANVLFLAKNFFRS
jgi:proline dehydrogenase